MVDVSLREAANSTAMVEIVRTRKTGVELFGDLFAWLLATAGRGVLLMWVTPLLHEFVGAPWVHPGYLVCTAIGMVLRDWFEPWPLRSAKDALEARRARR